VSENSIVLVGAGSTVFTPGLMQDLAGAPAFAGWTVHLVDLDADAANTMARLGRRIAREAGAELTFVPHTDRREALPGARFVTTTIAMGGADGWRHDLEVPARHGIAQTVGDSVGPGGVLRALRHVPEVVGIAHDVADLAPEALLVNYSNPLTANVRGVAMSTDVDVIGLCHGAMHTLSALVADLGLPSDEVTAVFAGVNHLSWLLELRHGSADAYPRLRQLVLEPSAGHDAPSSGGYGTALPVSADLLRTFGRYPAPGDRHVAEFFPWYLGDARPDEPLPWGLQGGLDDTRRYVAEKADLWERLHAQAEGIAPLSRTDNQEAERLVAICAAVVTGEPHAELAVNLPNHGLVANLPPDAVVEVPARVGADGVTGVPVGPLPEAIAAVLTARALQQELTVRAALEGSRDLALQALVLDPLVPGPAVASAVLDDAVKAHGALLERFAAPSVTP
jgi:alpha-galactosidase